MESITSEYSELKSWLHSYSSVLKSCVIGGCETHNSSPSSRCYHLFSLHSALRFYVSLRKEIMKEWLCEKLVTGKHQCQVNSKVYKTPAPVKLVLGNLLSVVRTYFHFSKILPNANVFMSSFSMQLASWSVPLIMQWFLQPLKTFPFPKH